MDTYTLHFDGSCWPNPGGTAACGYTLRKNGTLINSFHKVIGTGPTMSNNVAEYSALNAGLEFLNNTVVAPCEVNIYGDSDLVIKQMNKVWRIKSGLYYTVAKDVEKLCTIIRKKKVKLSFHWIPREANQECDDLSKAHLEEK